MAEKVGEIIKRLREERRFSQVGLSWATGIKPATLNNYESGHRKPGIEELSAIADALEISLDEFRVKPSPNAELTDEQIARTFRYEMWQGMDTQERQMMIDIVRGMKKPVKGLIKEGGK